MITPTRTPTIVVRPGSVETVVTEVGAVEVLNRVDVGINRGELIEGVKVEVRVLAGGTVVGGPMSVDGAGTGLEDEDNDNTVVDEVTAGSCKLGAAITRNKGNGNTSKSK